MVNLTSRFTLVLLVLLLAPLTFATQKSEQPQCQIFQSPTERYAQMIAEGLDHLDARMSSDGFLRLLAPLPESKLMEVTLKLMDSPLVAAHWRGLQVLGELRPEINPLPALLKAQYSGDSDVKSTSITALMGHFHYLKTSAPQQVQAYAVSVADFLSHAVRNWNLSRYGINCVLEVAVYTTETHFRQMATAVDHGEHPELLFKAWAQRSPGHVLSHYREIFLTGSRESVEAMANALSLIKDQIPPTAQDEILELLQTPRIRKMADSATPSAAETLLYSLQRPGPEERTNIMAQGARALDLLVSDLSVSNDELAQVIDLQEEMNWFKLLPRFEKAVFEGDDVEKLQRLPLEAIRRRSKSSGEAITLLAVLSQNYPETAAFAHALKTAFAYAMETPEHPHIISRVLQEITDEEFVLKAFEKIVSLRSTDPELVSAAMDGLEGRKDPHFIKLLTDVVDDPATVNNPRLFFRVFVGASILNIEGNEAERLSLARKGISSPDSSTRSFAIASLKNMESPESLQILREEAKALKQLIPTLYQKFGRNSFHTDHLFATLASRPDFESKQLFKDILASEETPSLMRYYGFMEFSKCTKEEDLAWVESFVGHSDPLVRQGALYVIAQKLKAGS